MHEAPNHEVPNQAVLQITSDRPCLHVLLVVCHPSRRRTHACGCLGFQHLYRVRSNLVSPGSTVPVTTFLAPVDFTRLRRGDIVIEQSHHNQFLSLLHHWRSSLRSRRRLRSSLDRLLRDFSAYPRLFAPQVLQARILAQRGDHVQAMMRVRQHACAHRCTGHDLRVTFARLDAQSHFNLQRGFSLSRSTSDLLRSVHPGTTHEHPLTPSEEHGFLWRLNTYWTWEERDGGLCRSSRSL